MPILERDPWRMQYFEAINRTCPPAIAIPTDDADAYRLFPEHRWLYNKLMICDTQGIANGPHGLEPSAFPVFSKPIYNMRGMGAGSRVLHNVSEYRLHQRPGHMWMELLEGEHVSSDVAVVDGEPRWWRHACGKALDGGMFDYWCVLAAPRQALEKYCGDWVRGRLKGYTGMLNLETIGGRIIEVHMRFADQWPDLYGAGWLDAVVGLHRDRRWQFAEGRRRDGYSVVLFGPHGVQYHHPDPALVADLLRDPGITSVQITFDECKPAKAHSMPPGGFRLAIINGWSLEAGKEARERLALRFWSTQSIVPKKPRRQPAAE